MTTRQKAAATLVAVATVAVVYKSKSTRRLILSGRNLLGGGQPPVVRLDGRPPLTLPTTSSVPSAIDPLDPRVPERPLMRGLFDSGHGVAGATIVEHRADCQRFAA
jgi:hypothetical protein